MPRHQHIQTPKAVGSLRTPLPSSLTQGALQQFTLPGCSHGRLLMCRRPAKPGMAACVSRVREATVGWDVFACQPTVFQPSWVL